MQWLGLAVVLGTAFQASGARLERSSVGMSPCDSALVELYEHAVPSSHDWASEGPEFDRFVQRLIAAGRARPDSAVRYARSQGLRGQWMLALVAVDRTVAGRQVTDLARQVNQRAGTSALPLLFQMRDRAETGLWDSELIETAPADTSALARSMWFGFACETARLGQVIRSDSALDFTPRANTWQVRLAFSAAELLKRVDPVVRPAVVAEFRKAGFAVPD
jgi:hypothetical protein